MLGSVASSVAADSSSVCSHEQDELRDASMMLPRLDPARRGVLVSFIEPPFAYYTTLSFFASYRFLDFSNAHRIRQRECARPSVCNLCAVV